MSRFDEVWRVLEDAGLEPEVDGGPTALSCWSNENKYHVYYVEYKHGGSEIFLNWCEQRATGYDTHAGDAEWSLERIKAEVDNFVRV